jgi:AcrR family transcriptional regulator
MTPTQNRKKLSHERIVEVAARAIRRAGYEGVSVGAIMREAGLTHGGFYAHFDSRDALLVAALERAGRDSGTALLASMANKRAKGASPVRALIETYLADKHLAALEIGCPIAALGSEMPRQAKGVSEAARARVLGLIQVVRQALPATADPGQAQALASAMVGALQLARALGGAQGQQMLAGARRALVDRFDEHRCAGESACGGADFDPGKPSIRH